MLFLQRPERLTATQRTLIVDLCEADGAITTAYALTRDFATIAPGGAGCSDARVRQCQRLGIAPAAGEKVDQFVPSVRCVERAEDVGPPMPFPLLERQRSKAGEARASHTAGGSALSRR